MAFFNYARYGQEGTGEVSNAVGTQPPTTSSSGAEEELKKIKSTLLTVLEQNFSCSICKYPCNQIVKADCVRGHRFCSDCLAGKEKNLFDRENSVQCPVCPVGYRGTGKIKLYQDNHREDTMIQQLLFSISPEWSRYVSSVRQRQQDEARAASQLELRKNAGEFRKNAGELRAIKGVCRFFRFLFILFIVLLPMVLVFLEPRMKDLIGRCHSAEWIAQIKTAGRYGLVAAKSYLQALLKELGGAPSTDN